ncbi:MAG: hypothetical protein K2P14_05210 [Anaeroplasmataceae bacterium]|nr:hypothetical protein [Anaeroplasmataceae bacterium]
MSYAEGLSASDVALLSGRNNNNDGFGDGMGAWWIIIFIIFAFMGWGRNGFGGNDGGSMGAADNYVLASDFATLQRQIDSGFNSTAMGINQVNQGLCDGFYAMNTGMLNGFGNVQQTLCAGFGGVTNAITAQGYESRLGTQNLASQLANCCCDIRQEISDCCCTTNRNIDQVNYNMAMNTNQLQNSMCNNTRDIIESQNNGTRAILDALTANRIEDKNAQIQAQQNEINALRLAASQEKQNNYLVNELKPCPIPAYITCNPYQSYGYTYANNGCGCNTGCNCGNF